MWAIAKKEIKSYFLSPIVYVFIGSFLIVNSLFFYLYAYLFSSLNFADVIYSPNTILSPVVMLIFIIPILTMRMFAEERKSGTEQILYTAPISTSAIVFGKLLASIFVVLVYEACTLMYYAILMYFGKPDISILVLSLIGFMLLAVAYISFGMFVSSITENQIVAVIITMIGLFAICIIPELFQYGTELFNEINKFSLLAAFGNSFPNGILTIQGVTLFISFSLLFNILTIIVISRRKSIK